MGDIIVATVKQAAPHSGVKKGDIVKAVIVRTSKATRRSDGSYIRFDNNSAVLIDNQGEPIPRPAGHPALRLTRELEQGNVLTVEPGLYFIDSLLNRWRQQQDASMIDWQRVAALAPCGGIRIEDNVLVTETGCENLTRPAFAGV